MGGGGGGGYVAPQAEYSYRLRTPMEVAQAKAEEAGVGQAITLTSDSSAKYKDEYNTKKSEANQVYQAELAKYQESKKNQSNDEDGIFFGRRQTTAPNFDNILMGILGNDWSEKVASNAQARNEMQEQAKKVAVTEPVEMSGARDIVVEDEVKRKPTSRTSRLQKATGSKNTTKTTQTGLKL